MNGGCRSSRITGSRVAPIVQAHLIERALAQPDPFESHSGAHDLGYTAAAGCDEFCLSIRLTNITLAASLERYGRHEVVRIGRRIIRPAQEDLAPRIGSAEGPHRNARVARNVEWRAETRTTVG